MAPTGQPDDQLVPSSARVTPRTELVNAGTGEPTGGGRPVVGSHAAKDDVATRATAASTRIRRTPRS